MITCSICSKPVLDNAHRERIITCAKCVQLLLLASQESKIAFKNKMLEQGREEMSRSIESFILPEDFDSSMVEPRLKRIRHLMRSKHHLRTFKHRF